MQKLFSHDYFYYNPEFKKEHTDFTGDDSFTPEMRMDYLKHYAEFLKRNYNIPEIPREVITHEELKGEMAELDLSAPVPNISKRIDLSSSF